MKSYRWGVENIPGFNLVCGTSACCEDGELLMALYVTGRKSGRSLRASCTTKVTARKVQSNCFSSRSYPPILNFSGVLESDRRSLGSVWAVRQSQSSRPVPKSEIKMAPLSLHERSSSLCCNLIEAFVQVLVDLWWLAIETSLPLMTQELEF